jgi:hypothetical protein
MKLNRSRSFGGRKSGKQKHEKVVEIPLKKSHIKKVNGKSDAGR